MKRHEEKARSLPVASIGDSLAFAASVALPTWSKGVIVRRPAAVKLAQRLGLDRRAVRHMQKLRAKYGAGPLLLRIPLRNQAILLAPDDVRRVLEGSPEPFATASSEKKAALGHFEPENVLVSQGPERAERRRFNEDVLETGCPVHTLSSEFAAIARQEVTHLLRDVDRTGEMSWHDFAEAWARVGRRVVLGDRARDDHELTEMLVDLRSRANWAFMKAKDKDLREKFHERLNRHLEAGEVGSLAGVIARTGHGSETEPSQQVAQWLFAFDPAGMSTARALALLATHPAEAEHARREIFQRSGDGRDDLPFLRSTVLEALRLWPTTPAILRQTTQPTDWPAGTMPTGTGILIFAPYFHRDGEHLPYADRFHPDLWLRDDPGRDWPLVPFSGGPAICPARNLVPLIASHVLAKLMEARRFRLLAPSVLDPEKPMPATLDNYSLRFAVEPLRRNC